MTVQDDVAAQTGALNYIGAEERIAAAHGVADGAVFTLGLPVAGCHEMFNPRRSPAAVETTCDWSHFQSGAVALLEGEAAYVDDTLTIPTHGSTHVDALGHIIVDGTLWGGHHADESVGGLRWASIEPVANTGIFGRAVIVDVAGLHEVTALADATMVSFADVTNALRRQNVEIRRGDILLVHTGAMAARMQGLATGTDEPGLSDDPELVRWITESQISALGSDTFANELTISPLTGQRFPLHRLLLHDRGIGFHEGLWLTDVVDACREDARWDGLYIASPLKLVRASASPVNPLFVR